MGGCVVSVGVMTQAEFGALVGVSQQAVSEMLAEGWLTAGETGHQWLLAYCGRLREQAAGRMEAGALSLSQERAALARAQREGIEIKNAVLRGDYAAVSLLAEVLASASQNVAERFEHLPGLVRKSCPDLPPQAIDQVMVTIAAARNEWVRQTATLVSTVITAADEDDAPELLEGLDDEPRAH